MPAPYSGTINIDEIDSMPQYYAMPLMNIGAPIVNGLRNALTSTVKTLPQKQVATPLTTEEILGEFYNINNPKIEISPQKYEGERTIEAVLNHLGSNGKNHVNIKTPQKPLTVNDRNLGHYLFENNPERLEDLNKVKRTFEDPLLIIKGEFEGKPYNYYAKAFKHNGQVRGHLGIARDKDIGQFFQTNYNLRKKRLGDLINNGQVTYNNLPVSTAPVQNSTPVTNIINDLKTNFNPSSLFERIMTNFRK